MEGTQKFTLSLLCLRISPEALSAGKSVLHPPSPLPRSRSPEGQGEALFKPRPFLEGEGASLPWQTWELGGGGCCWCFSWEGVYRLPRDMESLLLFLVHLLLPLEEKVL